MFSKTDTSKVIVLSRSTVYRDEDSSVPIRLILTPQFYLLKKEELPIKYAYQAKRIAPSIFEEECGGDASVRFFVFKCQESWCFIAYRPEEITTFLQERGIDPKRVEKICFAEQFSEAFQTPYTLDEKFALTTIDGTVVAVPRHALNDTPTDRFSASCPKRSVVLDTAHPATRRVEYIVAALLLIFAGMWFVEGLRYRNGTGSIRSEWEKLVTAYPQLQARYTRESILQKYQKTDRVERTKRETLQRLSRYVFRGVTLRQLTFDANGYTLRVSVDTNASKRKLVSLAKRDGIETQMDGNVIVLQGAMP